MAKQITAIRKGLDMQTIPRSPIIDCPRCDEGDERSIGLNVCGLCGCRFTVGRRSHLSEKRNGA